MNELKNKIKKMKTNDKNHDRVIDEAIYFLDKAQECLDEGLKDPESWNTENVLINKAIFKLLPQMYLLQQIHRNSSDSGEN